MNRATSATGWVRNPDGSLGYTWNPLTGCLNGCEYCYARKLANGRLKQRYLDNDVYAPVDITNLETIDPADDPFYPRFWPERLDDIKPPREYAEYSGAVRNALILQESKGIFVCDMSDLFGISIPEEWTVQVLNTIESAPQHRFYLLTKQPQNLARFSPFPDNCWVGVTATNDQKMWEAIVGLQKIQATVKYLSLEPLLEWRNPYIVERVAQNLLIDWLIIGAQSKPTVYPKIEHVREIVEAADKAGIPVFLKNNLFPLLKTCIMENWCWADHRDEHGLEKPHMDLRQEMPNVD